MKKEIVKQDTILLVGIQVRTNNAQEYNKLDGKIFPLVQRYFHKGLAEKIPHRKKPGTTFCAYTDYESDYTGDYTYFNCKLPREKVSTFHITSMTSVAMKLKQKSK